MLGVAAQLEAFLRVLGWESANRKEKLAGL